MTRAIEQCARERLDVMPPEFGRLHGFDDVQKRIKNWILFISLLPHHIQEKRRNGLALVEESVLVTSVGQGLEFPSY